MVKVRPFFTIQLTNFYGGNTQPVKLGIDTGFENIGFALVGVVCYLAGQLQLDNKTTKRLKDRAMYRRGRRNKHHWYRPARWNNRANSRTEGRLMSSVLRRLNRHIWLINKLCSLCPVTEVRIETASFDIQKIKKPQIQGEQYQQGDMYVYANTKAFLFAREHCTCQYCGKKIEQQKVNLHHIVPRSKGGTDKPDNLALLHETCHKTLHRKNDHGKLRENKQYKAETVMNVIRKRLLEQFPYAVECFGYETAAKRQELGLSNDHYIDAFVIARCTTHDLPKPLILKDNHKNNWSLQISKHGHATSTR